MEAIGQLAGGVAHDFNNLLTAILGYTELLIDGTRDPGLAADLEEIRKAGERAGDLTRQLLAFSQKQVPQLTLLDLNAVLSSLEKVIGRTLGDDVRLEMRLTLPLRTVKADPNQIERILLNPWATRATRCRTAACFGSRPGTRRCRSTREIPSRRQHGRAQRSW